MRLQRSTGLMLALLCASALTACSSSGRSGRADLPALDARLAAPCARPVPLAEGPLTADQVAKGWVRDRAALARCGDEKAAIVAGYRDLRAQLGGGK
mgnify:CR=1 FL=1